MQIEILLGKTEKFDELMAAAAAQEAADAEEQSWAWNDEFSLSSWVPLSWTYVTRLS